MEHVYCEVRPCLLLAQEMVRMRTPYFVASKYQQAQDDKGAEQQ